MLCKRNQYSNIVTSANIFYLTICFSPYLVTYVDGNYRKILLLLLEKLVIWIKGI